MGRQCDENATDSDDGDLLLDHELDGDRETQWYGLNDLPSDYR